MCRHAGAGTSMNSMPNSRKRACLFVVAVSLLMASALSLTTMSSAWSAGRGDVVVHTSSTPDEDLLTESDAVTTSSNLAAHEGLLVKLKDLATDETVQHGGIYVFELARETALSSKQLCAIESAAVHHETVPIVVALNTAELNLDCATEAVIRRHPQIQIRSFDAQHWIRITEPVRTRSSRRQSRSNKGRTDNKTMTFDEFLAVAEYGQISDYVRYVTLFKYGGIYMDSDTLLLRSLGGLRNAIGLQHADLINQAVAIFDKGHEFIKDCLDEFLQQYNPKVRESVGSHLVTKMAKEKWCPTGTFPARGPEAGCRHLNCSGVHVLPVSVIYPIPRESWNLLFAVGPQEDAQGGGLGARNLTCSGGRKVNVTTWMADSYAVHLWNHESKDAQIDVDSEHQLVAQLAKRNCPTVFQLLKGSGGSYSCS